jgi:uncharacterized protein YbaR (Trm112 family)
MEIRHDGFEMFDYKVLICPACSKFRESSLTLYKEGWLMCDNADCNQRYRIVDGIPRILTKSGDFLNRKEVEEYAPASRNFKTSPTSK